MSSRPDSRPTRFPICLPKTEPGPCAYGPILQAKDPTQNCFKPRNHVIGSMACDDHALALQKYRQKQQNDRARERRQAKARRKA